jgi:hypothetical protein
MIIMYILQMLAIKLASCLSVEAFKIEFLKVYKLHELILLRSRLISYRNRTIYDVTIVLLKIKYLRTF